MPALHPGNRICCLEDVLEHVFRQKFRVSKGSDAGHINIRQSGRIRVGAAVCVWNAKLIPQLLSEVERQRIDRVAEKTAMRVVQQPRRKCMRIAHSEML